MAVVLRSSPPQTASFQSQPRKLVALGDSLVYGYGDPEGGGWVERLRRYWMRPGQDGHVLYNLGIRGDGVHQVQRRLVAEFTQRGELRNRVPDGIILSVGTNDSARLGHPRGRNFTEFKQFQAAIAQLLDLACDLAPVWFIGMTPVNESRMPFLGTLYYNHADQHLYQEATQMACLERQVPYLNLYDQWRRKGIIWQMDHLSEDGLHPNAKGYQAIFEAVLTWPALADIVCASGKRSPQVAI